MKAQLRLTMLSAGGAAAVAMGVLALGAPDVTAQSTGVQPATATSSASIANVSQGDAVTTTTTSNMSFRPAVTATTPPPPSH